MRFELFRTTSCRKRLRYTEIMKGRKISGRCMEGISDDFDSGSESSVAYIMMVVVMMSMRTNPYPPSRRS